MAEKKAAVQAEKPKTEIIHLFKDNGRYSGARFVSVNGEAYLIQRGVDVEVPAAVAEVLRHSEEMDNAANEKIAAAVAKRRTYLHCSGCKTARRHCAAACWQVTGKLKRIDTRYGRHMLCRVFLVGRPLQLRNPPDGGVARSSPKGEPCLKEELPQLHRPLKRRGETAPSGREPF